MSAAPPATSGRACRCPPHTHTCLQQAQRILTSANPPPTPRLSRTGARLPTLSATLDFRPCRGPSWPVRWPVAARAVAHRGPSTIGEMAAACLAGLPTQRLPLLALQTRPARGLTAQGDGGHRSRPHRLISRTSSNGRTLCGGPSCHRRATDGPPRGHRRATAKAINKSISIFKPLKISISNFGNCFKKPLFLRCVPI